MTDTALEHLQEMTSVHTMFVFCAGATDQGVSELEEMLSVRANVSPGTEMGGAEFGTLGHFLFRAD